MVKLTPTDWRTLVRIFEADGFTQDRTTGSHVVLSKPGALRPVIVPKYAEVGLDVIRSNMRTAGMSRSRYFSLLEKI